MTLTFDELIRETTHSAIHLELRDTYNPDDPAFTAWRDHQPFDRSEREARWHRLVGEARMRGAHVRRARVISEPVSAYVRFEYDVTDSTSIAAGEQVRWLPRRQATDLLLPGNDFWVFDDRLARIGYFAGDGKSVGHEITKEPELIKLLTTAFESVWDRAIPHEQYRPV